VAFAQIQEWRNATAGTSNYDAVAKKIDAESNPPQGLIAHTAGRDSQGVWRVFDIWESREQAERFRDERLMPIVREMMQSSDDAAPPDVVDLYELHDLVRP
jgi:hypothetical protein